MTMIKILMIVMTILITKMITAASLQNSVALKE